MQADEQLPPQQQQPLIPVSMGLNLKLDLASAAAEAVTRGLVSGGSPWPTVKMEGQVGF